MTAPSSFPKSCGAMSRLAATRAAQLIEFQIAITIMDVAITQSFIAAITKIKKQFKVHIYIILRDVCSAGLTNSTTLNKINLV